MERLRWSRITSEERIPKSKQKYNKFRSEIESDYLRIVRSASYRRLQDKTQVFPLDNSDFVRTRLTHSMEVSSIAKLIGKQVCNGIVEQKLESNEALPDPLSVIEILNCAGLLHDLGNPPFGHFGESAIRNWFHQNLSMLLADGVTLGNHLTPAQREDFYHYEGNAQALRIVSKLHRLRDDYGMHLTSAVMDSIIKYPCDSLTCVNNKSKPKEQRSLLHKKIGYFQSEADIYHEIKTNTGCMDCRNPLAFILEAADDLAYTFADLEDGYKKGLYSFDDLRQVLVSVHDEKAIETLERGLNDKEACLKKGLDPLQEAVFHFLAVKQLFCVSQASEAFLAHYDDIMNGTFQQELLAVSKEAQLIAALKKFSFDRIYNIAPILKLELMGNEILMFLLDRFMNALIVYDSEEEMSEIQSKYLALLSNNYLDNYHRSVEEIDDKNDKLYHRLLLGCDFIAGMSDGFAKRLYQELKGI